jgi:hypothetical protein
MKHLHIYIFSGLLFIYILSVAIYKYIYYIPFYTHRTIKYNVNNEDMPVVDLTLNNVPAIVYQSCKSRFEINNPCVILDNYKNNSEFDFYLYDEKDQRKFIKDNFNSAILNVYDKLTSYNDKSKLWKYCILYKNGGIYLDTKYNIKKPLIEYISLNPIAFNTDHTVIMVPPNLDILKTIIDSYTIKSPVVVNDIVSDYIFLYNEDNYCKDIRTTEIIFKFD